jgi:hypothetical protein
MGQEPGWRWKKSQMTRVALISRLTRPTRLDASGPPGQV